MATQLTGPVMPIKTVSFHFKLQLVTFNGSVFDFYATFEWIL